MLCVVIKLVSHDLMLNRVRKWLHPLHGPHRAVTTHTVYSDSELCHSLFKPEEEKNPFVNTLEAMYSQCKVELGGGIQIRSFRLSQLQGDVIFFEPPVAWERKDYLEPLLWGESNQTFVDATKISRDGWVDFLLPAFPSVSTWTKR